MNLTFDGSSAHHGWYCKFIEIIVVGLHQACARVEFCVKQWLATDALPYQLYAERSGGVMICVVSRGRTLLRPTERHCVEGKDEK